MMQVMPEKNEDLFFELGKNCYDECRYRLAYKYFESSAQSGNIEAVYYIGLCFFHGTGVETNPENAFKCFKTCINNGYKNAYLMLGKCYYKGYGVQRDPLKALKCFKNYPIKSSIDLEILMAQCYIDFGNDQKYFGKIISLLNSASEQGCLTAQEILIAYIMEHSDNVSITTFFNEIIKINWENKQEMIKRFIASYLYNRGYYDAAVNIYKKINISPEEKFEFDLRTSVKRADKSFETGYYKNIDLVNKLKNCSKHIVIDSVADINLKQLNDLPDDAIIEIRPQYNIYDKSNTFYTKSDFKACYETINDYLKFVDHVKPDRSNEVDVFMQIYYLIINHIVYDNESVDKEYKYADADQYENRNLIGALLKNKCVCCGYAELLRNCLKKRGINCINIYGDAHAFSQVRINHIWYYVDATFDADVVINKNYPEFCLKGKTGFDHAITMTNKTHISLFDYPHVREIYTQSARKIDHRISEYTKKISGNITKNSSINFDSNQDLNLAFFYISQNQYGKYDEIIKNLLKQAADAGNQLATIIYNETISQTEQMKLTRK